MILETSSLLAIAQNMVAIKKLCAPYLKPKEILDDSLRLSQPSDFYEGCLVFDFHLTGIHLQIPSSQESKNSLFA